MTRRRSRTARPKDSSAAAQEGVAESSSAVALPVSDPSAETPVEGATQAAEVVAPETVQVDPASGGVEPPVPSGEESAPLPVGAESAEESSGDAGKESTSEAGDGSSSSATPAEDAASGVPEGSEGVPTASEPSVGAEVPSAAPQGSATAGPLELKFVLESLLFSAQKALTPKELKDQLVLAAQDETAPEAAVFKKIKEADIVAALETLQAEHTAAGRSYRLWCVAGAWQFVSEARYAPWLRALLGRKARPPRLSQPGIETLTIIAYRQPVTRAEIEQIRGVSVDGVMQTLLERGLVEAVGRAEVIGRPVTYGTTPAFLEYFGIRALEDLPAAEELRRIPVQKPEALLTVDPGLATAPADAPAPQVELPAVDPQAAGTAPEAGAATASAESTSGSSDSAAGTPTGS